jgi:tetratricopeptide (TPR) repeat protein
MRYISILLILFLTACGGGEQSKDSTAKTENTEEMLLSEIDKYESMLSKEEAMDTKTNIRKTLIDLYSSYATSYSMKKQAPEMLFHAGTESVNVEEYNQAINYLKRLETGYHEYIKRPEAIYLIAFIYENHLNKKGPAKEYYNKVINEYPEHVLASQAKQSIDILMLSDEELIKKFQENNPG